MSNQRQRGKGIYTALWLGVLGAGLAAAWLLLRAPDTTVAPAPDPRPTGSTGTTSQTLNRVERAPLKEYCAPIEKMCFMYPADWSVLPGEKQQLGNGVVVTADSFVVADADGRPVLRFRSDFGALGGACDPADMRPQRVVKAEKTNISGSYLAKNTPDFAADSLYVLQVVSATGSAYQASVYLSNSREFIGATTVHTCGVAFSPLFPARHSAIAYEDSLAPTSMEFTYISPDQPSEAAARQLLESPVPQQAAAILRTVSYR